MNGASTHTCLVVGGYGALGSAIADRMESRSGRVLRATRSARPDSRDAVVAADGLGSAQDLPVLSAVVWAHGVNINDSVTGLDADAFQGVLDTNVGVVARDIAALLAADRLADGARLVVVSSMWEQIARPNKFSYTTSKAAVGGLVRAAALDLGPRGILVNGVLPGVVDTPMTRRSLSPDQIRAAAAGSATGELVSLDAVASLVAYLCSPDNTGITGQSIAVDLGFTVAHAL